MLPPFLSPRSPLSFPHAPPSPFPQHRELVEEKIRVGEAGEDLKKLASTVLDIQVAEEAAAAAEATTTAAAAVVSSDVATVCVGAYDWCL